MRILYITTDYPGFSECLFHGADYPYGLPSFNKVLIGLIEKGHEVNYVLIHNKKPFPKYNIKSKWFKESDIKKTLYTGDTRISSLKFKFNLIKEVNSLLKKEKYDFVYCHGTSGAISSLPVRWNKTPFAQRLYGTFLWESILKKGELKTFINNISEYFIFKSPKKFLLVTNDGSRGDEIFNYLWEGKNAPYQFFYWINGVDKMKKISRSKTLEFRSDLEKEPFVFYCARFDPWKRQDRVVKIIHELKKQGCIVKVYFAGPVKLYDNSTSYYEEVVELAKRLDVENQVLFLGNINAENIAIMNKLSVCSMMLHDTCNMTNVFHESLATGAVVIAKDDGVVSDFIEHGKNGFLISSNDEHELEKDVAKIIKFLIENPTKSVEVRENAINTSKNKMLNWDERIENEISLLEKFKKK
ncbi:MULTISPECIES: glycosyltransferase family 4 protein [unclassified Exiguobacterium]|uniref:glycosyltransferase family 4 protein n=1 Tax=unclassified Exiguobacterium TaxID=2644629 RepID=UPI001BE86244|nr:MULTISPECIES: glycosyltransferase family 4 protein [unclassified Exiguobacterium]